ncbi:MULTISPECIES: ABC transporter substrate-binding protein [Bacillus]|uniref:ABC transporter substrate-binding protein n=1 Tax=Bacillus TaxID=1386 RepID=UPI00042F621D|nr:MULTISPECIES: iron-siderophore ABC transporter substrate-binding protein [Bacillus]AHL72754.1 iron ABC transporter substrate-binding protein [Bacillus pumilus]MBY0185731.1 iron-siderophore ABC transporter substrate-binding protein [Bacillus aerophilus]MCA1014211.1 iron-siderophore ABC transporter substrate-binding protein [Bacillus stratosphericus]KQU15541.1 iron ABC transporter substrate-binding protein [Bacillus sp. Leaf49]MCA2385155.1 iron-siderophore ABC transporter substrate-binding pr
MFKKSFWSLLVVLSIVLLAACGSNSSEGKSDSNEKTRTVESAIGSTEIKGSPKRVVTLYQGATDAAVAMGIKPVGVVESWLEAPTYKYLRDDLKGVKIVGQETQPNLEEIEKLKPDVIFASKIRHEEIFDQLKEIAPTVATDTVYTFKDTVKLMGEALDQQDKSKELLTKWDDRVADFKEKAKKDIKNWPLNVAVVNFRADHTRIYQTGFAGSILTELGFEGPKNIKDKKLDVVQLTDKESIPQMNADVIYYFIGEQDKAAEKTYKEWTSHPLWKQLDAVKAKEVHKVDEITWNMAGGIIAANMMLDDIYDRLGIDQ